MSGASRKRLESLLAARVPIDIGTTSLTGIRRGALEKSRCAFVAHPIYNTAPLSADDCVRLGSNFQRAGFLFSPRDEGQEEFVDTYGVGWIFADGFPAPYNHPLEKAEWRSISRYPKPAPPEHVQVPVPGRTGLLTVLDAPCPGLLDTCFALRNAWQFLDDLTGNWRIASALLDWAADTVEQHYRALLASLPHEPDVVVYGDDLGFQSGMYLSDVDFRNFLYPRMKTLLARLRRMTDAAICVHSCGAIRSILSDITELDVEIVNLDLYAKNMTLLDVRRELGPDVVLHAPINLAGIGEAVLEGNDATLALLATELAAALPAIAAPIDNIVSAESMLANFKGAAFVCALDPDDLTALRDIGAVRSIIEKAKRAASQAESPTLAAAGEDIPIGRLHVAPWNDDLPLVMPISTAAGTRAN